MLAILKRLPRSCEYVFAVNGSCQPPVAMTLRKALARHGGNGFTVHGMRSAFRDWGGERTNAPRELLEIALGDHQGDATERAYARSDLIEKRRRVMEQWAAFLATSAAASGTKVVAFAARLTDRMWPSTAILSARFVQPVERPGRGLGDALALLSVRAGGACRAGLAAG